MTRTIHRSGVVLILVVGMIALLATIATAFLSRARGDAVIGEDAVRLAQNRIMLHAAMSYVREASRLGYATVDATGDTGDPGEAWGWIDTRVLVPGDGSHIGPNFADGSFVGAAQGIARDSDRWPAPGGVLRVPMRRLVRPPLAVTPEVVRNAIPTDIGQPTFGIPFLNRPDPVPALPEGATFDERNPAHSGLSGGGDPRQAWVAGDRIPVQHTMDLGWFRLYREEVEEVDGVVRHTADERRANDIPRGAGPCTFIVTVGAGGTRGFRDWDEVVAAGAAASFGHDRAFFEGIAAREQRQWFRIAWSGAVGGGEDLIVTPAIEGETPQGTYISQYLRLPLNVGRWVADSYVAPSFPRNYGGTIRYVMRLDQPPEHW